MEDLFEIIKGRAEPGIMIFNMSNELLYINESALNMVPEIKKEESLSKKTIHKLCDAVKHAGNEKQRDSNCAVLNTEAGNICSLRAFTIGSSKDNNPSHILVLIEKVTEKHNIDLKKVKAKYNLSNRELEVLELLCSGLTNKEIAEKLFISEYTVKDHIKRLMEKLGTSSRFEIIAKLKQFIVYLYNFLS